MIKIVRKEHYFKSSFSCLQGDDVTSDTSGDTTTSDSGRGNSVDDVNFDQIMKGINRLLLPYEMMQILDCL